MSTAAAAHLSPAFPERAAWGTASKLRAWQAAALSQYLASDARDFLAVATPGAGKTTYALRVGTELLGRGEVRAVTVVTPTEHLKTQWADAAARVGIHLDPRSPTPRRATPAATTAWPSPTPRSPAGRTCTAPAPTACPPS